MATDTFINQLMEERDTKVQIIENLASVAADEGRDLHTTDLETIDNYRSRIRAIDNQIEKVAGDLELADSVKSRVRNLDPNILPRDFTYRSAGEYMWDALHRNENADAAGRFAKFHRAAEHMGYDKANTVPVAGGFNGLVIESNVGAVLDPSPSGRPIFNALGVRPITTGSFLRPRVVDPNYLTGVGPQGQEKSELPSKAWDIVSDPVQAEVIGGYINVSQLLIEMLSSSLDMVVSQMNKRLEYACEYAVIGQMEDTGAVVPLAGDDSAAVTAAIGEASALVFKNTGQLPTWIAMGPDAWGRLIGISDLAGRPLLPAVGPVNAWGAQGGGDAFITTFGGLRAIVSYAITDTEMFVGNSFGLEVYEKKLPVLTAIEPSVFGRQISVQTMLAFYKPVTTEAGPGNVPPAANDGVVKIDWT
jgi:HK97 family phage major capsid protein